MNYNGQIAAAIEAVVNAGYLAGATTLIWRGGEVVQRACVGLRDREAGLPIEQDTIFRIASMTKPITSVVALTMVEEGRFALSDPISRWAPEFSSMRVLRSPTASLHQTDLADRQISFEDLLTHRAGFTYGSFHTGPIARAYADALGGDIDSEVAPDDWIARLATLPLIDQPGAAFHYGHSTDLLGLLIARIEGAPLGDVLKRRLFDPLGMTDTGFVVPPEKRDRRSKAYGFDAEGGLTARLTCPGGATVPERPDDMEFVSGGQGLWSTIDDYLAFTRLFIGGGAVDNVRILRPDTLAMLTTNYLSKGQRETAEVGGARLFQEGLGFGLGVAVVLDARRAEPTICGGGEGAVGWPGSYGGWWSADVQDGSVMIFLAQNMIELDQLSQGIGFGVYEAISQFQALGSLKSEAK
ncbi:MAG: beta-lactamase family protein [Ignavibacteriae bacterium]|nr:beta-lactamase family protein [Ignavibacteriota bacterium]MCB9216161.1 beta-lactamase family protein [Ignavibacteria bacterium]